MDKGQEPSNSERLKTAQQLSITQNYCNNVTRSDMNFNGNIQLKPKPIET
jgi:hypothetical protein